MKKQIMSVFRSYFSKNNTLIKDNRTNNSQNPVTEISYGTSSADVSRFIFDINLEPLIERIQSGIIPINSIQKHVLRMTNTIRYRSDLIGGKFHDGIQQRTGSFTLDLFNVVEDWDEGNGYDFIYNQEEFPTIPEQASNWFDRKTGISWTVEGAYESGITEIIGNQSFNKGNEDIYIDVTDYINSRITGQTGTSFGLGIKFSDDIEALVTTNRQAVAFHTKKTNTFYEPFIETYFDTTIIDDRNYFYLDKSNDLYLYTNIGGYSQDVVVNSVTIHDYKGDIYTVITGDSIQQVRKGVYKITTSVDSGRYPDAVLFNDIWNVTVNGKTKDIELEFYLISPENYYMFDSVKPLIEDNYFFSFTGIKEDEKIKSGEIRRIFIDIKEFYPNQNNNIPYDVEYRLYVKQSDQYVIDVISWTKADRTSIGYEFNLDTSWLIQQDYFLDIRLVSNNIVYQKNPLRFSVISDGVTGVI